MYVASLKDAHFLESLSDARFKADSDKSRGLFDFIRIYEIPKEVTEFSKKYVSF